jgi:hypothetical protein
VRQAKLSVYCIGFVCGIVADGADKIGNRRQYCCGIVLQLYYFYCVIVGNILGGRTLQTSPIAGVY